MPVWDLNRSASLNHPLDEYVQIPTWKSVQKAADGSCLVVVCSQCCDLENPRDRAGVLVAPLMKVPASPGNERYAQMMASAEMDAERRYHYVHLFPFTLGDGDERDVVADLSAMTTVAPAARAVADLQASRLWSLEDDARTRFRIKLAFMLGRDPDRMVEP